MDPSPPPPVNSCPRRLPQPPKPTTFSFRYLLLPSDTAQSNTPSQQLLLFGCHVSAACHASLVPPMTAAQLFLPSCLQISATAIEAICFNCSTPRQSKDIMWRLGGREAVAEWTRRRRHAGLTAPLVQTLLPGQAQCALLLDCEGAETHALLPQAAYGVLPSPTAAAVAVPQPALRRESRQPHWRTLPSPAAAGCMSQVLLLLLLLPPAKVAGRRSGCSVLGVGELQQMSKRAGRRALRWGECEGAAAQSGVHDTRWTWSAKGKHCTRHTQPRMTAAACL